MSEDERSAHPVRCGGEGGVSRRQILRGLGAGSTAAFLSWLWTASARAPAGSQEPQGPNRVTPFALSDVRVTGGPFRRAEELDGQYLLTLEPDRLLHGFRANAGLTPKAAVYGGWESEEPWIDIRCQGHTLGHYLSACSLMFASTGEPQFRQRVEYIVAELQVCQKASNDGLICAFPDGAAQLDNSVSGAEVLGVPWYTMHKIYAGLRDAHRHAGSAQALDVLVELSEWACNFTRNLPDAGFQRMLDREHGGMNEVLADVFELTREPKYLTLARRFCHQSVLAPLIEQRDTLDGLHANTQIPKVIGFHRIHELTGEPGYRQAAEFFWSTVVRRRSYATGGVGDGEHFFPPREFATRLRSAKTMETCCAHNLLRLTHALFQHGPSVTYADYYERTLYNSILASQDPASGMMTYFQPTRPGYPKLYCTPTRSFWCCTGTGMENHAKYAGSVYFRDDQSLYINLFIPSAVTWREKRVTLTQVTRFPESDTTRVTIKADVPTRFVVKVRHPHWCNKLSVTVNGRPHTVSRTAGRYIELNRTWRTDDVIDIHLPMSLYTEELQSNPAIVAVLYGPLVLAGRLGRAGISPGADMIANERTYGDVLDTVTPVPAWVGQPRDLVRSIVASTTRPLTFRATGFEGGGEMELVPYDRIAHERYNLYWTVREPG
jgi:DUF1680 family protein